MNAIVDIVEGSDGAAGVPAGCAEGLGKQVHSLDFAVENLYTFSFFTLNLT
jgi:hypothetical protein